MALAPGVLKANMFQIGNEIAASLRIHLHVHDEFAKTLDTIPLDTGTNWSIYMHTEKCVKQ